MFSACRIFDDLDHGFTGSHGLLERFLGFFVHNFKVGTLVF